MSRRGGRVVVVIPRIRGVGVRVILMGLILHI